MAGLLGRLFGRRDEAPDIPDLDAWLDWSPGPPPPPPPAFRVVPPPPPPAPAPPTMDEATRILWGPPPPPPPPEPQRGEAPSRSGLAPGQLPGPKPESVAPVPSAFPKPVAVENSLTASKPQVRLVLTDGTIVEPPADPEWQGRASYLARNLLPSGFHERRRGPTIKIVLSDGTVLTGAADRELQRRIDYLARNLLPTRKVP
jgi:hypothetical protein